MVGIWTQRGVTRLQARQRGRFTRREYIKLLEFYHEEEGYLQETKQRQRRIYQYEQELRFLLHTTSDQLEQIRQFQYRRSARVIQRRWRQRHPLLPDEHQRSVVARPFDPFDLTIQEKKDTVSRNETDRDWQRNEAGGDGKAESLVKLDDKEMQQRRCNLLER